MVEVIYKTSWFFLSASLFLGLYRLLKGPYFLDRVLVFDLFTAVMAAASILFAMQEKQGYFVDVALLIGLLSFIGTVAFAYYWERGNE